MISQQPIPKFRKVRNMHHLKTEPIEANHQRHKSDVQPQINQKNIKLKLPIHAYFSDQQKGTPKNFIHDRESLYFEVLSLKVQLNKLIDHNQKLKTRIQVLEGQKERQNSKDGIKEKVFVRKQKNGSQSIRRNDTSMVDGLKKVASGYKHQIEVLSNQNAKLKKASKYLKVNQLQIASNMYMEENSRLANIIVELKKKMDEYKLREDKEKQLEKKLQNQIKQKKKIQELHKHLQNAYMSLQEDLKRQNQLIIKKQRKWQNLLNAEKKKANQNQKHFQEMRILSNVRQIGQNSNGNKTELRMTKTLYNHVQPLRREVAQNHLFKHPTPSQTMTRKKQKSELFEMSMADDDQRNKLKKQNEQLLRKLELIENKLAKQNRLQLNHSNNTIEEESLRNTPKHQIKQNDKQQYALQFQEDGTPTHKQKNKEEKYKNIKIEQMQMNQTDSINISENIKIQTHRHPKQHPIPSQKLIKSRSVYQTSFYKPDKQRLSNVKELLTYRMRSQRYSYQQLKRDIELSNIQEFNYVYICQLLVNEPFYLTVQLCRIVLQYMFEKERPGKDDVITCKVLLQKLRKLIKDFQLPNEADEIKMIQHCAVVVTQHFQQLSKVLEQQKNGNNTVSISKLSNILQRYKLSANQVQMIISQLSVCSPDIEHLYFDVLFESFYLDQIKQNIKQSNVIIEGDEDESLINISNNRVSEEMKQKNKNKGNGGSEMIVIEDKILQTKQ